MHRAIKVILGWFPLLVCVLGVASAPGYGVTIAEVAAKIRSLKQQERINYLLKGAQAEGELAYGTLPIDEFLPLARVLSPGLSEDHEYPISRRRIWPPGGRTIVNRSLCLWRDENITVQDRVNAT